MFLDELHQTLALRRRPEDVADLVLRQLTGKLNRHERAVLDRAARGALRRQVLAYTSMLQSFAGPAGLAPQLARARQLFLAARGPEVAPHDATAIRALIAAASAEIGKTVGASDFLADRLSGEQRDAAGILDSRRKYNRKFRLLRRMETKLVALVSQAENFDLTRIGKSGLATHLDHDTFVASESAACFVAYFTARCNLRSEFTVAGQTPKLDDIAEMLFARCRRDPETSWWAIAQIYPTAEVLAHLSAVQKTHLLITWLAVLHRIADRLASLVKLSRLDLRTMVVKRGNDSTTWNQTAQAWNRARDGWIALVYALGADDLLDRLCPGKVMRLVAGDLAAMHRAMGRGVEPNTAVWAQLPRPWEVLRGQRICTRSMIEEVCIGVGIDAERSGWIAPRPVAKAVPFRPTPELVHGVAVDHPILAKALRDGGWFSGKATAAKAPQQV